jgi:hypothetical protein
MDQQQEPRRHSRRSGAHSRPASGSWAALDEQGRLVERLSHEPHRREDPASTTKLWTLYTIASLQQDKKLSDNFMHLHRHDIDLMLVRSDNHAALRLAAAASGSVNDFCNEMNHYAARRGLSDSHFVTPNGWPQRNHYSSAHDMARINYLLERDFPETIHLASQHDVNGRRNTGHALIGSAVDFGKTGTGDSRGEHGFSGYGSHGRTAFAGGVHNTGYVAVAGIQSHEDRNRLIRRLAEALREGYEHAHAAAHRAVHSETHRRLPVEHHTEHHAAPAHTPRHHAPRHGRQHH